MIRDTKAFTNMLEMKCSLLTSEWVYGIIPYTLRNSLSSVGYLNVLIQIVFVF